MLEIEMEQTLDPEKVAELHKKWKVCQLARPFAFAVASPGARSQLGVANRCFDTGLAQAQSERDEAIAANKKEVNKVFLCEICNKQYTKVVEYDNHLTS